MKSMKKIGKRLPGCVAIKTGGKEAAPPEGRDPFFSWNAGLLLAASFAGKSGRSLAGSPVKWDALVSCMSPLPDGSGYKDDVEADRAATTVETAMRLARMPPVRPVALSRGIGDAVARIIQYHIFASSGAGAGGGVAVPEEARPSVPALVPVLVPSLVLLLSLARSPAAPLLLGGSSPTLPR